MHSKSAAPADRSAYSRLGLKFYRYKSLLRERWWIPLLAVGVGLCVEGWILLRAPVQHQSLGLLSVSPTINAPEGAQVSEEQNFFYGTQLQILQNPEIIERARRRVANEAPNLAGAVKITPTISPRTSIFSIKGVGSNPDYTRRMVDATMQEFINYKREKRGQVTTSAMGQVSEELARLRADLNLREAELKKFVEDNNMAFWEEQGKTAAHFLSDLKTQQANKMNELHRLENLSAEELLSQPSSSGLRQEGTQSGVAPINNDLNIQYTQKTQELIQKKAMFEEMSKNWKPRHPKLIAMQEEIATLQRLIGTIKVQNQDKTRSDIIAIKADLQSMESSIKTWEEKVMAASHKDAEYQRLQKALSYTQNMYEKLLTNVQNLDLGKNMGQETLMVMQNASVPDRVPPRTFMHLLTGILGGLLVGGLVLALYDRADDRITSSTEMIESFSESILGQIPNVVVPASGGGLDLLATDDERYVFAEAFRSLRSSLVFLPNQTELKSLIVTSSIPGEGKSTISSNLAITMALGGAKVLLVDADLRRGDLAALFDADGRFGLSSLLRGELPWKSVTQATKHSNLTLIPRGPVTNQSGELLMVPLFEKFLKECEAEYDLTIFNTSPILATDDTATIAPNFDGTLMVVRAQYTSAKLVHNSLSAMYQRQVNVLGLILNAVDTEMPDYYYYRYPKYYAA